MRTRGFGWRIAGALLALSAGSGATSAWAQVTVGPGAIGGAWGNARALPGLAQLNVNESAMVVSVSCATPTNCATGGLYTDVNAQQQPFVASERNGRWKTIEVPVIGLANAGNAETVSVSCPTAGNCGAGGFYTDDSNRGQAFVVNERNGAWGRGQELLGLRELNVGGNAAINSVSCWAAGSCVAGGFYTDQANHQQGFVVIERNGQWGAATRVPGLERLNRGGGAETFSTSCALSDCTAGGEYVDGAGHEQGFLATERGGRWSTAVAVGGLARLNRGGFANVGEVSCATAASCGATGLYTDGSGHIQSFVVTKRAGRWGSALAIPGLARLNVGGDAEANDLSCWAAGDCSVGGVYTDATQNQQAFVVTELGSRWGRAIELPGIAHLDGGLSASINSMSCVKGTCAAGGGYEHGQAQDAFVVTGQNGRWGKALQVPGIAQLNTGQDGVLYSLSCTLVGHCTGVGVYEVHHLQDLQGFVVTEK